MGEIREQRNMRKATRLMLLCIAAAVLALWLSWYFYRRLIMSGLTAVYFVLSLPLLPILFSAVFFCLYQRGFRPGQMILLLPVCAVILYQLYIHCRSFFRGFSILTLLAALSVLSETAFLLTLLVGLKKNDRRILRYGKNLLIATAVLWAIKDAILKVQAMQAGAHTINSLLIEACKMVIYALIAYRSVATDDITLPGYPIWKASVSTTQGGQVVMGTKSKVAAALLAFFLGTTGAHRYYLGYKKQGIIQTCGFVSLVIGWMLYFPAMMNGGAGMLLAAGLLLLYGGVVGIWAFVDFIRILIGSLAPADGSGYAAQQAQVVQPAPAPSSGLDDLEKLAKLRDSGILTEEEFQSKKADILARM